MPCYAIRAGEGAVKLGHSTNPQRRLESLQTGHCETLTLLRVWEGGAAEEAMLHQRFADLHIRGEWHRFSPDMLGDVGLRDITLDDIAPREIVPQPVAPPVRAAAIPPPLQGDALLAALAIFFLRLQGRSQEYLKALVAAMEADLASRGVKVPDTSALTQGESA